MGICDLHIAKHGLISRIIPRIAERHTDIHLAVHQDLNGSDRRPALPVKRNRAGEGIALSAQLKPAWSRGIRCPVNRTDRGLLTKLEGCPILRGNHPQISVDVLLIVKCFLEELYTTFPGMEPIFLAFEPVGAEPHSHVHPAMSSPVSAMLYVHRFWPAQLQARPHKKRTTGASRQGNSRGFPGKSPDIHHRSNHYPALLQFPLGCC